MTQCIKKFKRNLLCKDGKNYKYKQLEIIYMVLVKFSNWKQRDLKKFKKPTFLNPFMVIAKSGCYFLLFYYSHRLPLIILIILLKRYVLRNVSVNYSFTLKIFWFEKYFIESAYFFCTNGYNSRLGANRAS
jgi:hypothetical protein